jgi:hypothetical protein
MLAEDDERRTQDFSAQEIGGWNSPRRRVQLHVVIVNLGDGDNRRGPHVTVCDTDKQVQKH